MYAAGLGLHGPVDGATLDELVAFYRGRERQPRVQVTPYQHPTLLSGLTKRSFVAFEQEAVLVHTLQDLPKAAPAANLSFRRIDPLSHTDVAAFRDSQMRGFYEDKEPPAGMLAITERVGRHPRCRLWLLERDGQVLGSGGVEVYEETGALIGGCVHPEARCQGLHGAFIRFRLEHAQQQGMRYATICSLQGGPTERNALRMGFTVAYTQTVMHQE